MGKNKSGIAKKRSKEAKAKADAHKAKIAAKAQNVEGVDAALLDHLLGPAEGEETGTATPSNASDGDVEDIYNNTDEEEEMEGMEGATSDEEDEDEVMEETEELSYGDRIRAQQDAEYAAMIKSKGEARAQLPRESNELGAREGPPMGGELFDLKFEQLQGEGAFKYNGRDYSQRPNAVGVSSDKRPWTTEEAKKQELLQQAAEKLCADAGKEFRLYRICWQGREMTRDNVLQVLARMLERKIEVLACSYGTEMFNCHGVSARDREGFDGPGGGCYICCSMIEQPEGVGRLEATRFQGLGITGQEVELNADGTTGNEAFSARERAQEVLDSSQWITPEEFFSVGVPMVGKDGREYDHNLCVQMVWVTQGTARQPVRSGFIAGNWGRPGEGPFRTEERLALAMREAFKGDPQLSGLCFGFKPWKQNGQKSLRELKVVLAQIFFNK